MFRLPFEQVESGGAVSGCGYESGRTGARCLTDEFSKRKVLVLSAVRCAEKQFY